MPDLVGQTLGKYHLVDRLGRGGMADVYKAYQPGLDRYVALKVLHPHLAEQPDEAAETAWWCRLAHLWVQIRLAAINGAAYLAT